MDVSKLLTFVLLNLLGAMSPGPDFAIVTKNCIRGTFKKGFFTALGVATALCIHVSYCLLGVAILIAESPVLYHVIKYVGAAYLFYLGILLLKEKRTSPEGPIEDAQEEIKKKHRPFLSGFLCNLLNPKATLFVLSLFTQFVAPTMSLLEKLAFGAVIPVIALTWFTFLSYLITHRLLQKNFARFQFTITKAMGVFLCGLAIYVAISA